MSQQQTMSGPLLALAGIRFLAELGLLGAMGWAGFHATDHLGRALLLMVLLPLGTATVWGLWVAPKAARRLGDPARLAVEVSLFGVASLAMLGTSPQAGVLGLAVALWAAFLVSMPVRGRGL